MKVTLQTVIKALPDRIWQALTHKEETLKWIGHTQHDLRPGGAALFFWEDGDQAEGQIQEVHPPTQLVHTWIYGGIGPETLLHWNLTQEGQGTRLTLIHDYLWSEEIRKGYEMGWEQYLQQLRGWVEEQKKYSNISTPEKPDSIWLAIRVHATPERIWKALVDPAELGHWICREAEFETKRGGRCRLRFSSKEQETVASGRVEEWNPPVRLVYTFERENAGWGGATRVSFRLEPHPEGGTVLILVHTHWENLKADLRLPMRMEHVREWRGVLKDLREYLEEPQRTHR